MEVISENVPLKKKRSWFRSSKKSNKVKPIKIKDKKKKKKKESKPNPETTEQIVKNESENYISSSELCTTSTSILYSADGLTKIPESNETEEDIYTFTNRKKIKDEEDEVESKDLSEKVEIIEMDQNKSIMDERIQQYYPPEDINKVKEAIKAIEKGELDITEPTDNKSQSDKKKVNSNVLNMVNQLNSNKPPTIDHSVEKNNIPKRKNNPTNVVTPSIIDLKKNDVISIPKSTNEKQYTIPLKLLRLEDYGTITLSKSTTFAQLREILSKKTKAQSFVFQDVLTKRPLLNESKRKVLHLTSNVIVSDKGADILLGESVIHGSSSFATGNNGIFSFKVLWWDSHYHNNHQVWLKFEPGRITVAGTGGSFKLFDFKTLRVPLVFATVKGSDKAFQFLRNKGSSLASRFYSTTKEQRQAIAIYFCFVWRPQAVRRGWMPRLIVDPSIDSAGEVDDPSRFINVLKKHINEIGAIIKDLERRNDPSLVRKYLHLFQSMFAGGYTTISDQEFDDISGDGTSLRKRIKDWRNLTQEKDDEVIERKYNNEVYSRKEKTNIDEDDDILIEFGNDEDLSFASSSIAQIDVGPDITIVDGAPPPPPPPPALGINKKPPIIPINFDAIFQKDIKGTIWADVDVLNLSQTTIEKLEKDLTIIFGRDARDSGLDKKEEKKETVLDSNRLRNLEILLKMDELKGFTMDELIDGINDLNPRIYQVNVLERLIRRVGNGENALHAFLPSDKEIELLIEHQKKEGNKIPLTEGEHFLLSLSNLVKHKVERLEYSFFILKWQDEFESIGGQLDQIFEAVDAVKNNEKLKKVLKLILEILNVLNPKNGNTKGFKISSFIPKVERVHGAVANPVPNKKEEEEVIDTSNMTKEELKRARLEKLRKKKKNEQDAEGWKVLLLEYLSVYITKFKECRYFWKEIIGPCETACTIDILSLDKQCTSWNSQLSSMKDFLDNNDLAANDPLITKIKDFLRGEDKITKMINEVNKSRTETEKLWNYFGEDVHGEPQVIFKYVLDFSKVIENYYNTIKTSKDIKIKILKGQLPLIPHKPKPKKKREMAKKSTKNNSKLNEIKTRLETRDEEGENEEVENEEVENEEVENEEAENGVDQEDIDQ